MAAANACGTPDLQIADQLAEMQLHSVEEINLIAPIAATEDVSMTPGTSNPALGAINSTLNTGDLNLAPRSTMPAAAVPESCGLNSISTQIEPAATAVVDASPILREAIANERGEAYNSELTSEDSGDTVDGIILSTEQLEQMQQFKDKGRELHMVMKKLQQTDAGSLIAPGGAALERLLKTLEGGFEQFLQDKYESLSRSLSRNHASNISSYQSLASSTEEKVVAVVRKAGSEQVKKISTCGGAYLDMLRTNFDEFRKELDEQHQLQLDQMNARQDQLDQDAMDKIDAIVAKHRHTIDQQGSRVVDRIIKTSAAIVEHVSLVLEDAAKNAQHAQQAISAQIATSQQYAADSQRSAADSRRSAQDSQSCANDSQRSAHDSQRGANDSQRSAYDSQRSANDSKRSAYDSQRSANDSKRSADDSQLSANRSQDLKNEVSRLADGISKAVAGYTAQLTPSSPDIDSQSFRHGTILSERTLALLAALIPPEQSSFLAVSLDIPSTKFSIIENDHRGNSRRITLVVLTTATDRMFHEMQAKQPLTSSEIAIAVARKLATALKESECWEAHYKLNELLK